MPVHEDYEEYTPQDTESAETEKSFFEEYRISLLFALLGLISIGLGIFYYKDNLLNYGDEIEIVESAAEDGASSSKIIVEIAGAVKKPGVYELENGARINDLITRSGGLQDNYDRQYLDRIINRAAKLSDGQKIYIPEENEQSNTSSDNDSAGGSGNFSGDKENTFGIQDTRTKYVNVNSASQNELESLWGIGPVTAQNIIDQRPYSTVEELLTKKILKKNVYERNRDLLVTY